MGNTDNAHYKRAHVGVPDFSFLVFYCGIAIGYEALTSIGIQYLISGIVASLKAMVLRDEITLINRSAVSLLSEQTKSLPETICSFLSQFG